MSEADPQIPEESTAPQQIGDRLRAAREARGLSLAEMAERTKVNQRMLSAIERHALDEMPVGPYAAGFARAYARELGLDEQAAANEMRSAMDSRNQIALRPAPIFEPADENRVPTGRFALNAAIAGAVLLAAYFGYQWWADRPATTEAEAVETTQASTDAPAASPGGLAAAPTAAPVDPATAARFAGPLRIAATERAWFSLEDVNGRSVFDLSLAPGEFYTVREAQRSLKLRTNNPAGLRLVVGDNRLPLGTGSVASGVGLDAASLAQRAAQTGSAAASVQVGTTTPTVIAPDMSVSPDAAPGVRPTPNSAF